jgi:hypothetical protein
VGGISRKGQLKRRRTRDIKDKKTISLFKKEKNMDDDSI